MNLINFEYRKIWSTSKIRFLIGLVLLSLLLFFCYCLPKEQAELQALVNTYGASANLTTKDLENLSLVDWQKVLSEENRQLENYVKIMPAIIQNGPLKKDTSPGYTYYKKSRNHFLIDHNMKPISERYGTTGSHFSTTILMLLASSIGLVAILILFGDSLTKAIENSSVQLTLTQPISRKRYLLSLYALTWFQAVVFSLFLILVAFLLGSSISGVGQFNYPIIVSDRGDVSLIPLWQYMRTIFIIWIFVIGFILALHFLLSILLKKSSITLLGTLWLMTIGGIFSSQRLPFLMTRAHLNPFSYLNVGSVFAHVDWQVPQKLTLTATTQSATITKINDSYYSNLSLARYLQNPDMTVPNAILCLSIGIAMLLTLTHYLFSRKISLN
ncbi:ABC transporter permease subunit [uncultured Vagococcus sp.]|uniref:ABC transporter permease n=1 Tax=uncultured Vagococcus sp. TaxID=189676 RepID=UPI0028D492AE|nr:ABC transporter permease subunit [uncultured Vagococcus sp.]